MVSNTFSFPSYFGTPFATDIPCSKYDSKGRQLSFVETEVQRLERMALVNAFKSRRSWLKARSRQPSFPVSLRSHLYIPPTCFLIFQVVGRKTPTRSAWPCWEFIPRSNLMWIVSQFVRRPVWPHSQSTFFVFHTWRRLRKKLVNDKYVFFKFKRQYGESSPFAPLINQITIFTALRTHSPLTLLEYPIAQSQRAAMIERQVELAWFKDFTSFHNNLMIPYLFWKRLRVNYQTPFTLIIIWLLSIVNMLQSHL